MSAVEAATWLVRAALIYLGCGVLFSIPFLLIPSRGVASIDPGAREGTWGFRVMVFPGVVALWPVLLLRWISGRGAPPVESTEHRLAARAGGSFGERR